VADEKARTALGKARKFLLRGPLEQREEKR
jgi:hypothetical protein